VPHVTGLAVADQAVAEREEAAIPESAIEKASSKRCCLLGEEAPATRAEWVGGQVCGKRPGQEAVCFAAAVVLQFVEQRPENGRSAGSVKYVCCWKTGV
jgi:hypothetical protein